MTTSSTYLIERAMGEAARRDQIIDVVLSRMQRSEMAHSGFRAKLPRLYDVWRGIWTGRWHPHRNNVHIPLIYSAIWADAARKAQTSLGLYPVLQYLGFGPDDMPIARKWESLISAQMGDMDFFMKEVDTFVKADLYGTAMSQVGWRRDEDIRIVEQMQTMPISGKTIRTLRKGKVVTFDGPDTEPCDLLEMFVEPRKNRIGNLKTGMKWMIRRRPMELDDCRALAAAGVFDKAELDRMIRDGGVNSGLATDLASVPRFDVRVSPSDAADKYSRPVEILEMWGIIPSELADDGDTLRVITVANRRYLMRNRPLPFRHKRLPFLAFSPTPDPEQFFAAGKAEVSEKLQIVANKYINQTLDVADLITDPVWFYDRASGLSTKNLFIKPGRFIPVDGNPNEVVAPLQANLANLAVADQKLQQMREAIQMATGIQDDVGQGMAGPDRETARAMMARREAAGTRLSLESLIYERGYLEPLGNMLVALNQQFLEGPVEVLILGDSAEIDPVTKSQIVATRTNLGDDEILGYTYTARALGASTALSQSMKQQNLIQLLTAMASPLGQQAMGAINAVNFWRGIFREFQIPNINELFTVDPMLQQLVQQTGQGQVGAVPTSGAIAGAGQVPLPNVGEQQTGFDLNSMLQPTG